MHPVHILDLIAKQIYHDPSLALEEMFNRVMIIVHAMYWIEHPNIKKRPEGYESESSVDFVYKKNYKVRDNVIMFTDKGI